MDIVADTLSAGTLNTRAVLVQGKDVMDWFETKLSAGMTFVGVFDDLSQAPRKNGAIAVVESKDYVYSEDRGEWLELGDEGVVGALSEKVNGVVEAVQGLSALSADCCTSGTLSGCVYQYSAGIDWMAFAIRDILSAMGGRVEGLPDL